MSRLSRMVLTLPLVAILATPAVMANPLGGAQPRRSAILASGPMDFVGQLWSFLANVGRKNGSQMDPDGVQTKNGGQMDPSGGNPLIPIPMKPNQDHNSTYSHR